MTELEPWLRSVLVESMLKATFVLGTALAASAALRGRSAAYRHAIWSSGLAAIVMLPALVIWAPPLPVLPAAPAAAVSMVAESRPARSSDVAPLVTAPRAVTAGARSASSSSISTPAERSSSPAEWWLVVWGMGAAAILMRYLLGLLAARRLVRRAQPLEEAGWQDRLADAAARLRLSGTPPLLISSDTPVPLACGFGRPAIVMPDEARDWTHERRRLVLLHEVAHVRRRDCLTQALVQVACALYWFHPLVWLAARRLRAERERACDDLVLMAGADAPVYAEHLLDVARALRRPAPAGSAALGMARASELEGRLLAILDGRRSRATPGPITVARVALPALLATATVAALEPAAGAAVVPRPAGQGVVASRAAAGHLTRSEEPLRATQSPPAPAPTPTPTPAPAPGVPGGVRGGMPGGVQDETSEAAAVPDAVIEALTAALKDPDADVRRQALAALSRAGARLPREALAAAARDEEPGVRAHAIGWLARHGGPDAAPALIEALADPADEVRSHAAMALGEIRASEAVPALLRALADESSDVRSGAVIALAQLGAREAVPALAGALRSDESAEVREQAAFALGELRDPSTVDPLVLALKDGNADVRERAALALAQLRNERAVPGLIAALTDPAPGVREQAAFGLAELGDARGVDPLLVALKDEHPDVRERAAFALGQIGDARAVHALTDALKDESAGVREQAAMALAQLIGKRRER